MDPRPTTRRKTQRLRHGRAEQLDDEVLVEEPLELRIHEETLAITMRTPGHDRELAAGFLLAEGIIRSAADLASLSHCGRPEDEGYGNTLEVKLASGVNFDPERLELARRGTVTSSACGVCGRRTIEDLTRLSGTVPDELRIDASILTELPSKLRAAQRAFDATGGSHAAGLFTPDGEALGIREDVGRHNAVDKVIGARLLKSATTPAVLCVSGRASFEIVQKAAMAKLPVVCSVSAASALSINLADRAGITLVAFVRDGGFNLYTHPQRVTGRP